MRIGMTYDRRSDYLAMGYSDIETAEFDRDDTIDSIQQALESGGHEVVRIGHVKALAEFLVAGRRVDLVFNIAEGMFGISREAQVPALLEAYQVPCALSDAVTLALSHHKGIAKAVAAAGGVATPRFAVVSAPGDIAAVNLPFPLFVKPVAEGTGKGIGKDSKVRDAAALHDVCQRLLAEFAQPVLVETYLSGREFTVGVLGNGPAARSVGVMEIVLKAEAEPGAYGYWNKENCEGLVEYSLADDALAREAADVAVHAWRVLGGRDGGRVDIRADGSGRAQFIELNALPGLHPRHSDLPMIWEKGGRRYEDLISELVCHACARYGIGG